jgi:oligopeptidase B
LNKENEYYQKETAHTKKFQEELFAEMKGRIKEDDTSVPYLYNGYWYITRYETGKITQFIPEKGSLDAAEEILLIVIKWRKVMPIFNYLE